MSILQSCCTDNSCPWRNRTILSTLGYIAEDEKQQAHLRVKARSVDKQGYSCFDTEELPFPEVGGGSNVV